MIVLAGLFSAFIFAVGMTMISMRLARSLGIMDFPGEIKIHMEPTPRFGGFGIVGGTLLGFLVTVLIADLPLKVYVPVMVGSLFMASIGAIDDIRNIEPLFKLLGQLMSAIVFIILSWITFKEVHFSWFLFIFYITGIIFFFCLMGNSLNLLDGMDGLAAGTTVVIAIFLGILAYIEGKQELVILLGALIGACFGFLIFNIPPAKTFMGDIGSLFLGYVVAVATFQLVFSSPLSIARFFGVMLVLTIPLSDTCFAIVRRIRDHSTILSGDRFHLYDCISKQCGGSPWKTLGIMWGSTLMSGIVGLVVFFSNTLTAMLIVGFVIVVMGVFARRVGSLGSPLGAKDPSKDSAWGTGA